MSINILDGFALNSLDRTPLDKRTVVETTDELNNITKYAYEGMIVWVKNLGYSLVAVPSSSGVFSWQPIRKDLEDEIYDARGDESTINNRFIGLSNTIIDIQDELNDVLPSYSTADAGKVLGVGNDGKLYWINGGQPTPDAHVTVESFRTNLEPSGHSPGEVLTINSIIYKLMVSGDSSKLTSVKIKVGTTYGGSDILEETEVLSSIGTQSTISLQSTKTINDTTTLYMTVVYTTISAGGATSSTCTISFIPYVYFWVGTKLFNEITETDILDDYSKKEQLTSLPISYSTKLIANAKVICCYPRSFGQCAKFGYNGVMQLVSGWSKLYQKEIQLQGLNYYLYYYDANPTYIPDPPPDFLFEYSK